MTLMPLPLRGSNRTLQSHHEFFPRKFLPDGFTRFAAHLCGKIAVFKQMNRKRAQFVRIVGKKSAYSMVNRRSRMPVAQYWKSRRHGLQRGHVEAVLQL